MRPCVSLVSSEVPRGARTSIPKALGLSLTMMLSATLLPLLACCSTAAAGQQKWSSWKLGAFALAAERVGDVLDTGLGGAVLGPPGVVEGGSGDGEARGAVAALKCMSFTERFLDWMKGAVGSGKGLDRADLMAVRLHRQRQA